MKSSLAAVDGVELPYTVEGTGMPTLVTCDAVVAQRAFSQKLREHLQFVFMEPRVGLKYEQSVDYSAITMDTIVRDIERVREHLGLENIAVVGHSTCGILALEYARRYPENVSNVIMIGTPPGWTVDMTAASDEYWYAHASEDRKAVLSQNEGALSEDSLKQLTPSEAQWARYMAHTPKYWHDPRYDASSLIEGQYWNVEGWGHFFGVIMADYDITTGGEIGVPTFLALGRHDYVVPPVLWDDVRGRFPTLSQVVFEKSGHYPHLEEQALFDQVLLEWIRSH